jgi:hypothetical protein
VATLREQTAGYPVLDSRWPHCRAYPCNGPVVPCWGPFLLGQAGAPWGPIPESALGLSRRRKRPPTEAASLAAAMRQQRRLRVVWWRRTNGKPNKQANQYRRKNIRPGKSEHERYWVWSEIDGHPTEAMCQPRQASRATTWKKPPRRAAWKFPLMVPTSGDGSPRLLSVYKVLLQAPA